MPDDTVSVASRSGKEAKPSRVLRRCRVHPVTLVREALNGVPGVIPNAAPAPQTGSVCAREAGAQRTGGRGQAGTG